VSVLFVIPMAFHVTSFNSLILHSCLSFVFAKFFTFFIDPVIPLVGWGGGEVE
jgi:hypothetical protein